MSRFPADKELRPRIGRALRDARKRLHLSQQDAAERIEISDEFYARCERGHALPSITVLARMCQSLDLRPDEACGLDQVDPAKAPAPGVADEEPAELRRIRRRLRDRPVEDLVFLERVLDALDKVEQRGKVAP